MGFSLHNAEVFLCPGLRGQPITPAPFQICSSIHPAGVCLKASSISVWKENKIAYPLHGRRRRPVDSGSRVWLACPSICPFLAFISKSFKVQLLLICLISPPPSVAERPFWWAILKRRAIRNQTTAVPWGSITGGLMHCSDTDYFWMDCTGCFQLGWGLLPGEQLQDWKDFVCFFTFFFERKLTTGFLHSRVCGEEWN